MPVTSRDPIAGRERGGTPPADRALWIWLGGAALLALGTLLGTWMADRGAPAPPPGGRMLPRIAGSPWRAGGVLQNLGVGSLTWYACLAAAPLLLWLTRRIPIRRARLARSVAVHVLTVAALVAATSVAQWALTYRFIPGRPHLAMFLSVALVMNSVPLLTVAALVHALESWRRARRTEVDAARLGMQLAQARLDALTAQLQPHFLFNALQGISTLIHRDPAGADAMLGRLSDLLRDVLRQDVRAEVPLHEELRVLDRYLEISRQRLGDRLAVEVAVAPEVREARVPFFLLQPLVENAIEHGVAARTTGGRVSIRADRAGSALRIEIGDDGPGLGGRSRSRARDGIGLANTRERLRQLYGDAHRFALVSSDGGGVRVTITIPFRRGDRADDPAGTAV